MSAQLETSPRDGSVEQALARTLEQEVPGGEVCIEVARAYLRQGSPEDAASWCCRVVDAGLEYRWWDTASRLLKKIFNHHELPGFRTVRVAVLGSYTTDQLSDLLQLSAARRGFRLDVYQAGFGLYQQEILDPESGLYDHDPDLVLIAVHDGELRVPQYADNPQDAVEGEVARWRALWAQIGERTSARIVQTNFAKRPDEPFGHLSTRLPGARSSLVDAINTRLGEEAKGTVAIVDAERLASLHGKNQWFDDRYWHVSKQAVGLAALPLLARDITAVMSAELGASRKCLVVDLDGTLWGGAIGEDGLEGIRLGDGPDGEAFVSFQEYLLSLKERGVILAVCSKNDDKTAREPFASHPEMRMTLDDFAAFYANWDPKPENLRRISESLDLGLESFTFIDDEPAERAAVRKALPEIDVVVLPDDPSDYVRTLVSYPFFESSSFTEEDGKRTETYRARSEAYELKTQSSTLEEFLASLEMRATIAPFDDFHLSRIAQLVGKTNQFNLTTRRHSRAAIEMLMNDPDVTALYLKLEDRFTAHGLIGVAIGVREGSVMEIDTLLLSCRVIGRTAEDALIGVLAAKARDQGCRKLRGIYRRTERNGVVQDMYDKLGFEKVSETVDESVWEHSLDDELGSAFVTTQVL